VAKAKGSTAALGPETRVAVFHGPDPFLKDLHTQRLREALEAAQGGADSVEVVRYDGATASLADILDECRSMGLMSQYKLVLVDGADQLLKNEDDGKSAGVRRSNREILQGYVEAPSEQATLVLRADRWYPGNLDKAVAKVGVVMKLEPPTGAEAMQWAVGRCKKRHEAVLTPEGAQALVESVGPDLGRIDSELAKLALAAPGEPIGAERVRELVGVTKEEELWSIQRVLVGGDAPAALARLRDLLEVSRVDPVPLTWAYIDLAKKLHGVARGMAQGEHQGNLTRQYKLWPPMSEMVFAAARRLSPERAAGLLQAAIDADHKQKTSAGDAVRLLEALTLRFARAVGGSGR
jgi:DNA polymerase-3 subunit delta